MSGIPDYPDMPEVPMTVGGPAGYMEKSSRPRPLIDRLKDKRAKIVAELKNIDDAIAAIEANPETVKVLDALAKLGNLNHL